MLVESNINPKAVQIRLGHSDPGFTLRTYTHNTDKLQNGIAELDLLKMSWLNENINLAQVIIKFSYYGLHNSKSNCSAFPIAAVFMKKGVSFSNILIFIGAWSTTKIPMFLYESSALGMRFATARLLINIPGIIIT